MENGVMNEKSGRRGTLEILKRLRTGGLLPGELSMHERRTCAAFLELEGYTQEEMAEIFHVSRHTISRDLAANRKEAAHLVDDLDVRAVAGGHAAWANHLTARALKEKDYALVWKIKRELLADLQSLGYLPKVADRHEVRISSVADLMRLAIEQEEKQALIAPPPIGELPEAAVIEVEGESVTVPRLKQAEEGDGA